MTKTTHWGFYENLVLGWVDLCVLTSLKMCDGMPKITQI
jgi:hypothetical protein